MFWLVLFWIEDRKGGEPTAMIAEVFVAGAISGLLAAALETFAIDRFATNHWLGLNTSGEFLVFALIEEVVIFIAVYLMLSKKRLLDDRVSSMVYMITAALGFATLENVFYLLSASPATALQTALIRAVGATLLHAVASGFIGFYWAERKLVKGVVIAILIHFAFNCLAFFLNQQVYSIVFVLLCSFFIFHDFDILKEDLDNGRTSKQRK